MLAAGQAPQQQPADRFRVAQGEQDRQPRASRGTADEQRQCAELASQRMQVVGPDLVLRTDTLDAS
jgi:hypothetical protein